MKSITDEIVDIPPRPDAEFMEKWRLWVSAPLGRAYEVLLRDTYPTLRDVATLPAPTYDPNTLEDELCAVVLEQNLLTAEISRDRAAFLAKIEQHKFTFTEIYQAFILETARLWRYIRPRPSTIRRIWYKGFKVFVGFLRGHVSESNVSILSNALKNWTSDPTVGFFYSDVYVQDASRKMLKNDNGTRGWYNIILGVDSCNLCELEPRALRALLWKCSGCGTTIAEPEDFAPFLCTECYIRRVMFDLQLKIGSLLTPDAKIPVCPQHGTRLTWTGSFFYCPEPIHYGSCSGR